MLVIIGGAMVLFIVSDFINSGSGFFQQMSANVAKVNGDKIKIEDYQRKIDQLNDVVKMEYGNQTNDEMGEQIQQMVWENTITEKVIADECDKLGMMVTKEELADILFGQHISPLIMSSRLFRNADNQFDPNVVKQIIAMVDNQEIAEQYSQEDFKTIRNTWQYWEHATKTGRLQEKYQGLLAKAMVSNPLDAKYSYESGKTSVDILCTSKNYFAIADSTITVDEKDVKALYEKKKEQFKRENKMADIQYIAFEIAPSKEDIQEVANTLSDIRNQMNAENEEMKILVNTNSETPFVEGYMTEEQVPENLKGFAFSGSDSVYGPVLFDNKFTMAKVTKRGIFAPDSVKLSVIVLDPKEEGAKEKADSLEALIAAGADFATLAAENSKAQNAKKGGEIGMVTDVELTRDLAEKVFSTPAGKSFRMEENGAIQIFYVNEVGKSVAKVQLAIIEQTVTASSRTRNELYSKLQQYVTKNKEAGLFEAEAPKANMPLQVQKNLDINATSVNGLKKMREAVKWVFENEEGAVSDVIEGENWLVAIAVDKIYDKGYRSLEEVRDALVAELRRDKKGEMLVAEMQGKTAAQLEAMGYHTDTVRGVTFANSYAGAMGNEPKLVAHANYVEIGKTSEPINGQNAAYIFTVLNKQDNPREYDEKEEMVMLSAREQYSTNYFCIEALKRLAEIEDFRYKYY